MPRSAKDFKKKIDKHSSTFSSYKNQAIDTMPLNTYEKIFYEEYKATPSWNDEPKKTPTEWKKQWIWNCGGVEEYRDYLKSEIKDYKEVQAYKALKEKTRQ